MGRRSNVGTARAAVRVRVLALHPAIDLARPCVLTFSARGVLLEPDVDPASTDASSTDASSTDAVPAPAPLLRVPWWAVRGFSADETVRTPDGVVQALDLDTDAGRLRLAASAPDVAVALSVLSDQAARWRRWRHPAPRWAGRHAASASAAGREAAIRIGRAARTARRRPVAALVVAAVVAVVASAGTVAAEVRGAPQDAATASVVSTGPAIGVSGTARLLAEWEVPEGSAVHLAPAAAPPPPAPPSVADAPALSPHEVFGFVPYWMLGEERDFDVGAYTTLAYFAVGVNANGTLDETGTGWDGYESQDFADLVARAHASGARVVLTVNCFSPWELAKLTSSKTAASVLASAVVAAIGSKHLDGVNIDFEDGTPADRTGLTSLVATVSAAVHAANPHFQVTADTYASSASEPQGFYDVRALASVTDGLFVMAYGENYGAQPTASSPITSGEMSDVTEAAQYAAAVPPSKVIFGTSYFGYSWATNNGTMAAHAVATGTPLTYSQVVASGHPMYWDPVTETAWTSYEVHGQWYEDYVDDPASVYLVAQLAQREGFAGVGVWALGMDGNDPQMTAALDGNAPAERAGPAGPVWTAPSKSTRPGTTGGVTPDAKGSRTDTTTTTTAPGATPTAAATPSNAVAAQTPSAAATATPTVAATSTPAASGTSTPPAAGTGTPPAAGAATPPGTGPDTPSGTGSGTPSGGTAGG